MSKESEWKIHSWASRRIAPSPTSCSASYILCLDHPPTKPYGQPANSLFSPPTPSLLPAISPPRPFPTSLPLPLFTPNLFFPYSPPPTLPTLLRVIPSPAAPSPVSTSSSPPPPAPPLTHQPLPLARVCKMRELCRPAHPLS